VGIRLNKKLGWALTGLERDEHGRLTDPRVSLDGVNRYVEDFAPLYLGYLEALRDAEPENSDAWFDLMMSIEMVKAARDQDGVLNWPVTCRSDAGYRDLLLIQPVGYQGWSRYGDPLDQQEEAMLYPGMEPRVVPMPYGIYPFEGLYMDSRTGQKLDSTAKRIVDRLLEAAEKDDDKREDRLKAADHLAKSMGFENAGHAKEHIAPIVPPDVRYVISWLNLLNGPDAWLQLRPVLYVYWS
jgi:hypothetical protein